MAGSQILNNNWVKVNNITFDLLEGSWKIKKGYGEKEFTPSIGEGGKINANYVEKSSTKFSAGEFQIYNTPDNQTKFDTVMQQMKSNNGFGTISAYSTGFAYPPIVKAIITNDPEWTGGTGGITISFAGEAVVE